MNELALFAGGGGGILGGHLLGWRCVCAVEIEDYPRRILLARQRDGMLPRFPIWDDITTFDGRPWRGRVDVISGGFPCQDISAAGRGAGITGERSGLWVEMARIIGEVRPRFAFVENSPMLTSRGLGTVLGDLASLGYDARWGIVGAHHAGAPHKRDRIWIVADATGERDRQTAKRQKQGQSMFELGSKASREYANVADARVGRCGGPDAGEDKQPGRAKAFGAGEAVADADGGKQSLWGDDGGMGRESEFNSTDGSSVGWWVAEPDVGRVAHGVAARVDRLKALGNGQVPAVAALAWRVLSDNDGEESAQ